MAGMAIIRHYPLNRTEFEERYDSDAACYGAIARITLRKEMKCPRCGGEAGGTMVMASVESRGVPWKKQLWQCRQCRHKFNALGNTVLAETKLPLRTWFRLFWWMCATDEPTSARKAFSSETQAEQGFQIKQERSAWTALQRIRRAMMPKEKLSGTVQLGLTEVRHLYRRRGSPEACAAIAAIREPYAATIATLPCLESDAITQFAIRHIAPGSTIITGRASRFDGLGVAGFVQTREPQTNPEDPFTRPRFVDQLAKHLDSCMTKVHHAQVSECNLPEYFAEFSFRHAYAYKSVGQRFYKLLQTILK